MLWDRFEWLRPTKQNRREMLDAICAFVFAIADETAERQVAELRDVVKRMNERLMIVFDEADERRRNEEEERTP